jgi:hypothetical protein
MIHLAAAADLVAIEPQAPILAGRRVHRGVPEKGSAARFWAALEFCGA